MKRQSTSLEHDAISQIKRQRLAEIAALHRSKLVAPVFCGVAGKHVACPSTSKRTISLDAPGDKSHSSVSSATLAGTPGASAVTPGSGLAPAVTCSAATASTVLAGYHVGHGEQAGPSLRTGSGDDSDTDSLGSVVAGVPSCNPLHLLSRRTSSVHGTAATCAKPAALRSGVASEQLGPPSPSIITAGEAPQAEVADALDATTEQLGEAPSEGATGWWSRRDMSEAARVVQAELASTNADLASREGLAESGRGKKGTKAKSKESFPYGNYNRYYGYRLGRGFEEDPRLQALKPDWFAGKRVLDIGCNEGVLTLALTCKFGCKSMHGVDIDRQLVCKASRSLGQLRAQLTQQLTQRVVPPPAGWGRQMKDVRSSVRALKHTQFKQMDFVNDGQHVRRVDTVLCLSVTKWVHFNWGDEGVMRLFARIHRTLHPGGLFVLEPQPWRSYKSVFKKQETIAVLPHKNLDDFKLMPDHFADFLVRTHNFELVQQIEIGSPAKGFDRPLLVFRKR